MRRKGIYYIGRIIKRGVLTKDGLIQAILEPIPIVRRKIAWTFLDTKEFKDQKDHFVYGRLSKYSPEAEISIVVPERREEVRQKEPNLSIAASPFVYIPAHSGVAFMHVPNHIEHWNFTKRFCDLITSAHKKFFVDCSIEMITDLRTFAMKLKRLDGIYKISAMIYPPNPLYGPLWKQLKEYLISRNAEQMVIEEESKGEIPIRTNLPDYVSEIADLKEEDNFQSREVPIGDAAILMAADGYGAGIVKGKQDDVTVVIKTSETIRNFSFDKIPDPKELYRIALAIFDKIKMNRHMEHE